MAKLNITDSMITFIKENREKYKISAAKLADAIGKSSAYVSKFDKGDYKMISYDDLLDMLSAIGGSKSEGEKLLEEYFTNLISNNNDKNESNYDIKTYDNVLRMIDIPIELRDYINNLISENKLTISDIVNKANENADLPEFTKNQKYEFNEYYPYEKDKSNSYEKEYSFVKIKVNEDEIVKILSGNVTKANYLTMDAILYTISRMRKIGEHLSSIIADNILSKYHFYNLEGTKLSKLAEQIKNEAIENMNAMSDQSIFTLSEFIKVVSVFYNKDVDYAIAKTTGLHRNLMSDASLVMAIFDIPLFKVKDINIEDKRKLIKDIEELIVKYSELKANDDNYQII